MITPKLETARPVLAYAVQERNLQNVPVFRVDDEALNTLKDTLSGKEIV